MLANKIRPKSLNDVVGQKHLVGKNGVLSKMIEKKQLLSIVLYGSSGCGKTTIARIITNELSTDYMEINATNSNKKDLEAAIAHAKLCTNFILIVDEIHRLNKDKQDILLPHIESGLITLIGLTNANPFHALNTALRSRIVLLEVKNINNDDMKSFLIKVINESQLSNYKEKDKLVEYIVKIANQDIRYALNQVELLTIVSDGNESIEQLTSYLNSNIRYDKNESNYYDVISSLQKSIRGSDVNAALFYLAILILSEDLDIIERRLLVCAYEDIGLADPYVVDRVFNALKTARMVGFPEAKIPLAFAVVEMALASKSNKAYEAISEAIRVVANNTYEFNEYLKATPKEYKQKELYWQVPYENRHLIQYLPNEIKDVKFYKPYGKSKYEMHLKTLNDYLNNIDRSNDLKSLIDKINKSKSKKDD